MPLPPELKSPRKWLARLSFTFMLIGAVLAWEGYQTLRGARGETSDTRVALYFIGATVAFALGFAGVRERHRQPPGGSN